MTHSVKAVVDIAFGDYNFVDHIVYSMLAQDWKRHDA